MQKYCGYCGNKKALRAVLYHFTDFDDFPSILRKDILRGSELDGDKYEGISLTRNSGFKWKPIRLALNTTKLMQDGKQLKSFDYFENFHSNVFRRKESEEVLLGDLSNLHKYLLGIDIKNDEISDIERPKIIEWTKEYIAKHNLKLDTNFMRGIVFKFPRDEKGNIPSRYDMYRDNKHLWKTLEDYEENIEDTSELILEDIIKLSKRIEMLCNKATLYMLNNPYEMANLALHISYSDWLRSEHAKITSYATEYAGISKLSIILNNIETKTSYELPLNRYIDELDTLKVLDRSILTRLSDLNDFFYFETYYTKLKESVAPVPSMLATFKDAIDSQLKK